MTKSKAIKLIIGAAALTLIIIGLMGKNTASFKNDSKKIISEDRNKRAELPVQTTSPKENKANDPLLMDAVSCKYFFKENYQIDSSSFSEAVNGQTYDYDTTCCFSNVEKEEQVAAIEEELKRFTFENDHIFWIGPYKMASYDNGLVKIDFENPEGLDANNVAAMNEAFKDKINSILDVIDESWDAYQIVLYIHNYLIDNTVYDPQTAAETGKQYISDTAYGCLVNGKATCIGYSKAFSHLLSCLRMEAGIILGETDGKSGTWNYVDINGNYYWLDIAMDAIINEDEGKSKHFYYFLSDDKHFLKNRTIDEINKFVPECNSLDDYYYKKNNMYFEKYSFDDIDAYITKHSDEGKITLVFASEEEFNKCREDLITNEKLSMFSVQKNVQYKMYENLQRFDFELTDKDI